jgi:putative NIF3 family GTP cyclohydrolase 1 type 2
MPSLEDLAVYLRELLKPGQVTDDLTGIYVPSVRAVVRLGLALEPSATLAEWVCQNGIDAMFLHRPQRLTRYPLPPDVGVLASHLAFDLRLTVGYNPYLAATLEMHDLALLHRPDGVAIGMVGTVDALPWADWRARIATEFQGIAAGVIVPQRHWINRVAVAGAMTEALVWAAVDAGADVYVTGEILQLARAAVDQSGIGVIAVGHERVECWGLRCLARLLKQHFSGLQVSLAPFS